MASEGQSSDPPCNSSGQTLKAHSWAAVVRASSQRRDSSPLEQGKILEKLKGSVKDFIQVDPNCCARANECFQYALYGKFLDKTSPLDQVKVALMEKWRS